MRSCVAADGGELRGAAFFLGAGRVVVFRCAVFVPTALRGAARLPAVRLTAVVLAALFAREVVVPFLVAAAFLVAFLGAAFLLTFLIAAFLVAFLGAALVAYLVVPAAFFLAFFVVVDAALGTARFAGTAFLPLVAAPFFAAAFFVAVFMSVGLRLVLPSICQPVQRGQGAYSLNVLKASVEFPAHNRQLTLHGQCCYTPN